EQLQPGPIARTGADQQASAPLGPIVGPVTDRSMDRAPVGAASHARGCSRDSNAVIGRERNSNPSTEQHESVIAGVAGLIALVAPGALWFFIHHGCASLRRDRVCYCL